MEHRFILEPYSGPHSRYLCPKCQHRQHTFTRYADTENGDHLAEHVGLCDRIESCGYHYPPREHFKANPGESATRGTYEFNPAAQRALPKYSALPMELVQQSMRQYERNNFVQFLVKMFGRETANDLTNKYQIGTASHWPGATIFWQIDHKERVRTGKIMLYDVKTCKRVKQPFNHITWVHALLARGSRGVLPGSTSPDQGFQIKQCLFGEHLLHLDPSKTVAITESEKTAIIASAYYPKKTWLACGSLQGLTVEKCKVLEGRTVWLYPDVNAYEAWREKARELQLRMPTTTFRTDKTLEFHATDEDRLRGIDMADRWIDDKLQEWIIRKENKI